MDNFPKDLRNKLIAHLRRVGYLNITYKSAMQSAHQGWSEWKCCKCGEIGKRSDLHGDHVHPVIDPEKGFIDWNTYMERLFLGPVQPLCKKCHAVKTKEENKVRKERRKDDKWEEI